MFFFIFIKGDGNDTSKDEQRKDQIKKLIKERLKKSIDSLVPTIQRISEEDITNEYLPNYDAEDSSPKEGEEEKKE